ncbi:aminophospholipid-transporting P-type ATPase [Russula earlei]|uniref:Aminophospholipid-transporting P-type ATPase n=1 Tax=Russula earlei TaxID=71964 RepID=A0ACC0UB12_9AGAM|nr:aminophospholipid-transporting P-type ATPase [Russula earlei]
MSTQPPDPEKSPRPDDNDIEAINIITTRAVVAFPGEEPPRRDEKYRPAGVELKRQLTQEEMRLADAGYEHLTKDKSRPENTKFGDVDITEHSLPIEEIQGLLNTSFSWSDPAQSRGLTTTEAEARLQRDGPNALTPPKKKSALQKYIDCLRSMFNIILIISGILEYILLGIDFHVSLRLPFYHCAYRNSLSLQDNIQNTYLGGILIGVAFLNAFIEFYQLQKSEAILASFLAMIPPSCRVLRDGNLNSIPAASLVKGDVVLLRVGDKTPADLLIFASIDLKIDNSSLTGESEPQERGPSLKGTSLRPVEAENLAFNSTLIVNGEGWGVVVRTGDHTLIGQIARLTGGETGNKSPLAVEIARFVMLLSGIAILFAIVFLAVGVTTVYKGKATQTFTFAVSILVAFVPEGLPSTVTLLLSIAAKRMAAQNVLVKDLQGVETLGSLTLLATDKTGTLTRNQMTVTNLWSGGKMFSAFQSNNDEQDTATFTLDAPGMNELVATAALNSRIKFDRVDVEFSKREIMGDATETGLARFAGRSLSDYDAYLRAFPKVFEVPFNSMNKWALVIVNKPHDTGRFVSYIKGAPERVLAKSTTYLKDGKVLPIDNVYKESYEAAYNYMASRGHRVIGCAQYLLPEDKYPVGHPFSKKDQNFPDSEYCFLGLVSLEDPPKHGVREAIGTLRLAGIRVIMVTGDHPKTAEAIARKINLMVGDTKDSLSAKTGRSAREIYEDEVSAVVIHGDDIDSLEGWQWDLIFDKQEIVFARTSPQHKLEIVKRAQALGHIVGVTGDGVNDSPALKRADLGIAMNISGSDVSKEAANMILLDDNFASTVKGVQEGRQIFVNLKRSIQYTITHTTPEVIPQLLYVIIPVPLPLSAILILVIDLGFELFVALTFAWDKPETMDSVMRMPPRKPVTERSIMNRKRRSLRRSKTLGQDTESQLATRPSRLTVLARKLKSPFTREFWVDRFESSEGETLVDAKVLSYSYLEIGIIETIGSLLAYFVVFYKNGFSPNDLRSAQKNGGKLTVLNWRCLTPSLLEYFKSHSPNFINYKGQSINGAEQVEALAQAQSIVYLSIFFTQCFNVFAVKAKFHLPFGKSIISNKYNFLGIVGGGALVMFIIYTPPFHSVFGGSHKLLPLYWLISMAFGCLILLWASIRVLLARRSIERTRVKDIQGLRMFPTLRTMSMRSRH